MTSALIRVPASTANLGPAFDSIAVALNLTLTCMVAVGDAQSTITASGKDKCLIPLDQCNLVARTATEVARMAGRTLPPLKIDLFNEIPISRGLGSSAAARVAGILTADAILKLGYTRPEVLSIAAQLEGHADNAAAAVFGGCVVCSRVAGEVVTASVPFPATVRITLLVPDFTLDTETSRQVLPEMYSRSDVVCGISHTGLLVAALATGNLSAMGNALSDGIHQPYRAALIPGMTEALNFRAEGSVGCALSGSGPSLVVLTSENHCVISSAIKAILEKECRHRWDVCSLQIAEQGYCVVSGEECYV